LARGEVAGPDWRLRCVIENEALIGEAGDELLSYAQMAAIYKDVVAEPERIEHRDATTKGRSQEKLVLGLRLHDMSYADETGVTGEHLELLARVVRLKVDPSDHTGIRRVLHGELQPPGRPLQRLPRLHSHTPIESHARHLALAVRQQKVAPQRRHRVVYPPVLDRAVTPEMLMCVDAHVVAAAGSISMEGEGFS